MQTRAFGATGVQATVIGQGTWNMERDDRREAVAALRRGLELGLTHIDTAELYGRGRVEGIVGEAIAGQRERCLLVSKVLPDNASRKGTITACERSLRALKTDHLDGYLLHWAGQHPLEDTVAAFEELVQAGKIRWWGVSNFDEDELAALLRITTADRVACNQVLYHLGERSIEHALVPACQRHNIAVVGYSPFGSGDFPAPGTPSELALAAVGLRHGATPRQVALAFLVRLPGTFTIPKASRAAHVEENAGGVLALSEEDLRAIEQAFPRGPRREGVPTL